MRLFQPAKNSLAAGDEPQLNDANGPPPMMWPRYPASRSAVASVQNSRPREVNTIERPVMSGEVASTVPTTSSMSPASLNATMSAVCPRFSSEEAM